MLCGGGLYPVGTMLCVCVGGVSVNALYHVRTMVCGGGNCECSVHINWNVRVVRASRQVHVYMSIAQVASPDG